MLSHRLIEELTLNAWPPLQTLLFDGWLLSFSSGYTRRANSIHPLYAASQPLAGKIAECEATYAGRGQPTVFKITSAAEDAELDAVLARAGYISAAETSVQTAALAPFAHTTPESRVSLATGLEPAWLQAFNRLSATPEHFHAPMRGMLERIVPTHAFATVAIDGATVAMGLAVAERGYLGLFDIIVDATHRNQHLGRGLVTRLLEWGAEQGAHTAHLSVMRDNAPALGLYAHLGFTEMYRYWYRARPRA